MIYSDQNRTMTDLLFNYNLSDITPKEPLLLGGFANRKASPERFTDLSQAGVWF